MWLDGEGTPDELLNLTDTPSVEDAWLEDLGVVTHFPGISHCGSGETRQR